MFLECCFKLLQSEVLSLAFFWREGIKGFNILCKVNFTREYYIARKKIYILIRRISWLETFVRPSRILGGTLVLCLNAIVLRSIFGCHMYFVSFLYKWIPASITIPQSCYICDR